MLHYTWLRCMISVHCCSTPAVGYIKLHDIPLHSITVHYSASCEAWGTYGQGKNLARSFCTTPTSQTRQASLTRPGGSGGVYQCTGVSGVYWLPPRVETRTITASVLWKACASKALVSLRQLLCSAHVSARSTCRVDQECAK